MEENEKNKENLIPEEKVTATLSNSRDYRKENRLQILLKHKNRKYFFLIILLAVSVFIILFILTLVRQKGIHSVRTDVYNSMKKGDYKSAQEKAKIGLQTSPNDSYLLKGYIDAKTAEGNQTGSEQKVFKEIEPQIQQLAKQNSSDAESLISIGYAYETAGDYQKALDYYEQALKIDPNSANANFHKGHVLAFLDRMSDSKIAYNKAISQEPGNPLVLLALGNLSLDNNNIDTAFGYFKKVTEQNNVNKELLSEAYTSMANVELTRNNVSAAKEYARSALAVNNSYSSAFAIYGYILCLDKTTYPEGIKYMEAATQQNPRIAFNYFLIGIIMRRYGYYKQAVGMGQIAVKKIDNDNSLVGFNSKKRLQSKILYELAQTYSLMGDALNTNKYLSEAFNLNPGYKNNIKKDIQQGYFPNVSRNSDFIKLINS